MFVYRRNILRVERETAYILTEIDSHTHIVIGRIFLIVQVNSKQVEFGFNYLHPFACSVDFGETKLSHNVGRVFRWLNRPITKSRLFNGRNM